MNPPIFVDSSAWIAIADQSESRHRNATRIYKKLLASSAQLATSDLVLSETFLLLRRRLGFQAAMKFIRSVNASFRIDVVYMDSEIELASKALLEKFEDQDFSFTDACSFAWMKSKQIKQAFAYDHHFVVAGFELYA